MRSIFTIIILLLSLPAAAFDDDIPTVGEILGGQVAGIMMKIQQMKQAKEEEKQLYAALRAAIWLCQDCDRREELDDAYRKLLFSKDVWYANQILSGLNRQVSAFNPSTFDRLVTESPDGAIITRCKGYFERWGNCLQKDTRDGLDILLQGADRYKGAIDKCNSVYVDYEKCRDVEDAEENFPDFTPDSPIGQFAIFSMKKASAQLSDLYHMISALDTSWVSNYGRGLTSAATAEVMQEEPPEGPWKSLEPYMVRNGYITDDNKWLTLVRANRYRDNELYEQYIQLVHADELDTFDLDEIEAWLAAVEKTYGSESVEKKLKDICREGKGSAGNARTHLLIQLEYSIVDYYSSDNPISRLDRPRLVPLLPANFDAEKFRLIDNDSLVVADQTRESDTADCSTANSAACPGFAQEEEGQDKEPPITGAQQGIQSAPVNASTDSQLKERARVDAATAAADAQKKEELAAQEAARLAELPRIELADTRYMITAHAALSNIGPLPRDSKADLESSLKKLTFSKDPFENAALQDKEKSLIAESLESFDASVPVWFTGKAYFTGYDFDKQEFQLSMDLHGSHTDGYPRLNSAREIGPLVLFFRLPSTTDDAKRLTNEYLGGKTSGTLDVRVLATPFSTSSDLNLQYKVLNGGGRGWVGPADPRVIFQAKKIEFLRSNDSSTKEDDLVLGSPRVVLTYEPPGPWEPVKK